MGTSLQDLIAQVGSAVQAYQRSTDALDDGIASRVGVNRTDLRCLDWLYDGPLSVGHLAEAIGLSSAATTTVVDRLEQKGFVRRVGDPVDRRRTLVELSEHAGELGALYAPLVEAGSKMLAKRTAQDLETIRDFLLASRDLTDAHRRNLPSRRSRR